MNVVYPLKTLSRSNSVEREMSVLLELIHLRTFCMSFNIPTGILLQESNQNCTYIT